MPDERLDNAAMDIDTAYSKGTDDNPDNRSSFQTNSPPYILLHSIVCNFICIIHSQYYFVKLLKSKSGFVHYLQSP